MDPKKLKAIAAAFATMAEAAEALSALFSSGGSAAADDAGDDDTPAKPATRRSRAKPAKAEEITEDTVREALKELATAHGKDAMADALAEVGAGRLSDVDANDYQALMDAVKAAMDAEPKTKPARGKAPAKGKKPPAPTYDEVEEAFKELMTADKAAAKAVLKEAGLAKLSAVDQDDEQALTELMDAIKEAADEDDMV